MASTFSEGKTGLDEISLAIRNATALLNQARSNPSQVVGTLDGLASQYATLLADIDAAATAMPGNVALQVLKAEKDLLVAEWTAKRGEAANLVSAIDGV